MTRSRALIYLLPLFIASACFAQDAVETSAYLAFNKEGPIALGKVVSVNLQAQSAEYESGTLTLEITEQLRGDPLPPTFDVAFGWMDPKSPSYLFGHLKGPPPSGFDRVRPVIGMHLLVMYPRRKPTMSPPLAVLNLDAGEDNWVPIIRRAIAMNSLTGEARTNALLGALSDSSEFMRAVSMHSLLQGSECLSGSSCCDKAVEILSRRAQGGPEKDRLEAVDWLEHRFYNASAKDTKSNRQIISTLLAIVTDQNKSVRRRAIDELDQLFSPDMNWRPDPSKLAIPNRAEVMRVLREEQEEGGESAKKAKHLADAIGISKE